jgi:hypothetical protein
MNEENLPDSPFINSITTHPYFSLGVIMLLIVIAVMVKTLFKSSNKEYKYRGD